MKSLDVFLSVGGTANEKQENFVTALENRLRAEGIEPHTLGRNAWSSGAPLKKIKNLMDSCYGTVVVALERTYFPTGIEKRGGKHQKRLEETKFATPWNQIEAAMAYSRKMPLFVIAENGLQDEGLLERGYDWYVLQIDVEDSSLNTPEFNGILADWKEKTKTFAESKHINTSLDEIDVSQLSVGKIIQLMKPIQLWALLVVLGGLVSGAFSLGAGLFSQ